MIHSKHVSDAAQIHYGRASLSPLSKLPAYFVFTRQSVDCTAASKHIARWAHQATSLQDRAALLLLPDQPLAWAMEALASCLQTELGQVGYIPQPSVSCTLTGRHCVSEPSALQDLVFAESMTPLHVTAGWCGEGGHCGKDI